MQRTALLFVLLGGCGSRGPAPSEPAKAPAPAPTGELPTIEDTYPLETRSPWPPATGDREREVTAACGAPDGALARVASALATERSQGGGAPDPDHVVTRLRAHGEPHVRPRVVSVASRGPNDDARVQSELAKTKTPTSRCGVAFAGPASNERMVAVIVDALADLDPFPTRGRTGQWLTFAATIHAPATNAKLVVLGSRGLPRTIPTSLDRTSGKVVGRFALDRPGAFTVQLMADLGEGPRPLLEARVFSDATPSANASTAAPDEGIEPASDDAITLARMTEALRHEESLPVLRRDERLDALARAHVDEMKTARAVAHDLGDGDLAVRFESAGLAASVVGENVARARTLALAHRALYASPSHRMNLLRADYTRVGYAVARDGDDVYVCEVFAGGLR